MSMFIHLTNTLEKLTFQISHLTYTIVIEVINLKQCALAFFNPDQEVHGLFHFYVIIMCKAIQNQLKKNSYRASIIY